MHAHEPVYIIYQFLNCRHDYALWLAPKPKVHVHFHLVCPPPPHHPASQQCTLHSTTSSGQSRLHTGAGQSLICCVARWPKIPPINSKLAPRKLSAGRICNRMWARQKFFKKRCRKDRTFFSVRRIFPPVGPESSVQCWEYGSRTGPDRTIVLLSGEHRLGAASGSERTPPPSLPPPSRAYFVRDSHAANIRALIFSRNFGCFLHSFLYQRRSFLNLF